MHNRHTCVMFTFWVQSVPETNEFFTNLLKYILIIIMRPQHCKEKMCCSVLVFKTNEDYFHYVICDEIVVPFDESFELATSNRI